VSQSNFPYAQLAGLQAYRNAALLDLSQRKPQLLEQQPESGSLILVAATALSKRLIELHRDPEQLRRIERRLFEEVVAELFHGFGYSVELTARTRDGGRDIIALGHKDQIRTKYLIECKRPDPGNPVGVGLVRQLFGVVEDEGATKGLLVATTYFSQDARAFEERNEWRLELKDYEHVVDWIAYYVQLKGL
jgi:restriction system protein